MEKLLAHYQCPMPLNVVKMRFAGAVCTDPSQDLPFVQFDADVIDRDQTAELLYHIFRLQDNGIFQQVTA